VPPTVINCETVHLSDGATLLGKQGQLAGADKFDRFEDAVLPHLDAAYNLARWLIRDDHEAQDAVQDAYLRAIRFFSEDRIGLRRGLDAPPEIIDHFLIAMLGWGRAPRAVWQFSFAEARR